MSLLKCDGRGLGAQPPTSIAKCWRLGPNEVSNPCRRHGVNACSFTGEQVSKIVDNVILVAYNGAICCRCYAHTFLSVTHAQSTPLSAAHALEILYRSLSNVGHARCPVHPTPRPSPPSAYAHAPSATRIAVPTSGFHLNDLCLLTDTAFRPAPGQADGSCHWQASDSCSSSRIMSPQRLSHGNGDSIASVCRRMDCLRSYSCFNML